MKKGPGDKKDAALSISMARRGPGQESQRQTRSLCIVADVKDRGSFSDLFRTKGTV